MSSSVRFLRAAATVLLALAAVAAHAAPGPGDVPPPTLGRDLDGKDVRITDYAGKAVVLSFWATWCPYCLKELPILDNVQRKAGLDRLRVIAVNTEERDVFRRAGRVLRPALTVEFSNDESQAAQTAYGVTTLPHMVIIGRDGRIVRVYHGYSAEMLGDIVADINRALDPVPAPAAATAP